jgi:release factor glutamine methyltransferase
VISRFRDLTLLIPPTVFAPRSDAGDLIDAALPRVTGGDVLDLCTGSGVVALSLAPHARSTVAIDRSRAAVAAVRANALLNGRRVSVLRGDLLGPVAGRRFDCIVANPPYLPMAAGARRPIGSAAWDGGGDGRAIIDRLCREAPAHLRPGGRLLLVQSSLARDERTLDLLEEAGLRPALVSSRSGPLGPLARANVPDARAERIVVVEARRPSGSVVTSPAHR